MTRPTTTLRLPGRCLLPVLALLGLLHGCGGGGGGGGSTTPPPPAPTLSSVQVTAQSTGADSLSLAAGSTGQLVATALYSDGSKKTVTDSASWTSATPAVATVGSTTNPGLVSGVAAGQATVTATYQSVSGSTAVTVTAVTLTSVSLSAAKTSLPAGLTSPLTVTGVYSDGTHQDLTASATFSSSNPAVATVPAGPQGTVAVTAVGVGQTQLTATVGGIASAPVTVSVTPAVLVSLAVSASSGPLPKGLTRAYTAMGTYSDGTVHDVSGQATWASSVSTVASVNASGIVTALMTGQTTVSATLGSVSGSAAPLTVTSATLVSLAIAGSQTSVPLGVGAAFTAKGTYSDQSTQNLTSAVTWVSSDTTVATISNAQATSGQVTTLHLHSGTSQVSASLAGVTSNTVPFTVTSAVLSGIAISLNTAGSLATPIPKGSSESLVATGTYTDGTTQDVTALVTWAAATPAVATVGNHSLSAGLLQATGIGTTSVSATDPATSVQGTATINVYGYLYLAGGPALTVCTAGPDYSLSNCRQAAAPFPNASAGVATDGTQLFVSDNVDYTILQCPLNTTDGSVTNCTLSANLTALPTPAAVAYGGVESATQYGVYFAGGDGSNLPNTGQIYSCLISPYNCQRLNTGLAFAPVGIAASATYVYVSSSLGGVWTCAADPTSAVVSACSQQTSLPTAPSGIALNGSSLYVTDTTGPGLLVCTTAVNGSLGSCATSPLSFQPAAVLVTGSVAYVADVSQNVYRCTASASGVTNCALALGQVGFAIAQMALP